MIDKNSKEIAEARMFARKVHDGQVRDGGEPYFEHLADVAKILEHVTNDEDLICAAYLHDIIEDTDTTREEISEKFGERVADLVMEVTHEGEADQYGYYFPRLESKEGIMLKLADRLSNIGDMDMWSKGRQEHYLKKTQFWKDGSDKD